MRRQRNLLGPQGMGGMVGLWGGNSLIQSVQSGTSAATSTATITAVDTSRAVILYQGVKTNTTLATDNILIYLQLTNSTTVTATRANGNDAATGGFTVIEFMPGVLRPIQTGLISMGGGQTSLTATINAVNTAKSVCLFLGNSNPSGGNNSGFATITLTNTTTVTVNRIDGTSGCNVSYAVLEFF